MNDVSLSQSNKPLKVVLLPPINRKYHHVIMSIMAPMDIGLGRTEAACTREGADVTLLSWKDNLEIMDFKRKLLEIEPDIVGVKVFTTLFKESYETLRSIREVLPNAVTVIGGPHPSTSRPEDIFAEFGNLLDFAIAGDSESGIVELIKQVRIAGGKPDADALLHVPGLMYIKDNGVFCNDPILDLELDTLAPMNYSIQQPAWFGSFHGVDGVSIGASIEDSRGCKNRCGFCLCHKINGSAPRHRSMELLWSEIDELVHKYNVRVLDFMGNSFMSDVDYVRELCRRLIEFPIPLRWTCTGAAYVCNLRTPGLLELMRRAGCFRIHFGIESGNPEVRKRLCQPVSLYDYTEIVNLTAKTGICATCYFMFGFPDETVEEMNDTIKYAFSLPYDSIGFRICLPLPGTSSYKAVLEQRGIDRIDWSTYNFPNPNLLPSKASPKQVRRKYLKAKILSRSRLARGLYKLIH